MIKGGRGNAITRVPTITAIPNMIRSCNSSQTTPGKAVLSLARSDVRTFSGAQALT